MKYPEQVLESRFRGVKTKGTARSGIAMAVRVNVVTPGGLLC